MTDAVPSTTDTSDTDTESEENMNNPTKCVLLACGSFNPVTNMHLRMFEIARDALHRTQKFTVIKGIISPVSDGYNKKRVSAKFDSPLDFDIIGNPRLISLLLPKREDKLTAGFRQWILKANIIHDKYITSGDKLENVAQIFSATTHPRYLKEVYADLLPASHRCEMLKQALKSNNWINLDTWECEQSKWSETAKVLKYHQAKVDREYTTKTKPAPTKKRRKDLRNVHINSNDGEYEEMTVDDHNAINAALKKESVNVRLLCGADLLESFGTPGLWADKDIEDIVGKYGLVCITRAGSDPRKFIYESDVLTKYQENIFIVTEWIFNDISSTKIRRALRRGESVKYLLQDVVIDYIKENHLYGVEDNKYVNDIIPSPMADSAFSEVQWTSEDQTSEQEEVPRSPKRLNEEPFEGPPSPKSPRHVPCMGPDLGSLVRRVRNYSFRQGMFQHRRVENQ